MSNIQELLYKESEKLQHACMLLIGYIYIMYFLEYRQTELILLTLSALLAPPITSILSPIGGHFCISS